MGDSTSSDFAHSSSFLSSPPPQPITATRLDFTPLGLPDAEELYAIVLDNCFSQEECDQLVSAALAHSVGDWERARLDTGGASQVLITDVRNSSRIMLDSPELASRIWARVQPALPAIHTVHAIRNRPIISPSPAADHAVAHSTHPSHPSGPSNPPATFTAQALNERLRFLRYDGPGEFFAPHYDGVFTRADASARSLFTLHLYLNEADAANPLDGGATTFHAADVDVGGDGDGARDMHVVPRTGRVLVFQQRGLLHSGEEVRRGTKVTLRTDVMYARVRGEGEVVGGDGESDEYWSD